MAKILTLTSDIVDFFDLCPTVMLLFEIDGYRIKAANDAAAAKYGYSKQELADMTIMDLRPSEDVPRIARLASRLLDDADAAGTSRHVTRDGETFVADVHTRVVELDGRLCKLAAIHDVTHQAAGLEAAHKTASEATEHARAADARAQHFAELFNLVPGRCAVLRSDTFQVVAANDEFLDLVQMARTALVGCPLFDPSSGKTAERDVEASTRLCASLRLVAETGHGDVMEDARLPYDAGTAGDRDVRARRWFVMNVPLTGSDGSVPYIMHSVSETDPGSIGQSRAGVASGDREVPALDGFRRFEAGQRSRADAALARWLAEREGLLRTMAGLLRAYVWRFDVATGRLEWTDDIFRLYGIPIGNEPPTLDEYFATIHPDDQDDAIANYEAHFEGDDTYFTFAHRILRPDGKIVHLSGAAKRIVENGRTVLSGIVQDVTAEREAEAKLRRRDYLMRVAGEVGRIGGWRVDLDERIVEWSPETAHIHESPETRQVGLQQGFDFYPPEYRDLITDRFNSCAETGAAFDEVLQIVTARGNRVWVRAVGAAERDARGRIIAVQGAFQDLSRVVSLHQQTEDLRARLGRVLEGMSDAFVTFDTSWRFSYLNRMAEGMLKRGPDALLGRHVWSEFPETVGTLFDTELRRAVETGDSVEFEEYNPALETWFRVTAHPSDAGLAVYFRDVTLERATAQRLRLLDTAVSRMNDILLITEAAPIDAPDGPRIVYANTAFERLTGYAADEVIGGTPRMLQGPDTDRHELDRIRSALERHAPVRAEIVNYARDGRQYWLEIDIAPLTDDTGQPTHFVALQRNTTERRQAEATLRLAEQRFRMVTQATKDVIWDWDILSGKIWWNDNLLSVFGHDPAGSTDVSHSGWPFVHPDDLDRLTNGRQKVLNGMETSWQDDYRVLRADGTTAHVQDRGFVLRDENGKAVRMIGSVADITREREAEAILRQSQKLEAVGQLTGGVAHDFNNLLTVVLGNAELLAEDLTERDDLHLMADEVIGAAQRGADLTGRLLAFARQQPLDPLVIDVNMSIRSLLPLMQRSLGEDAEIRMVPADDLWLTEIDPGQFDVALLNLAINARDAMPTGGRVTIETLNTLIDTETANLIEIEAGSYIVVAVTDTGSGMSPEVVERVLEPFFTTKDTGTGLGLPMAFGFARQSGGYLKIYSEVGEGTTVKLYFPRSASRDAHMPARPAEDTAPRGRGQHILVVEDDPFVRRHAVAMIRSLGYRVSEAEDAATALTLLTDADDITLLFTDIVMPGGMNGRQLADAAVQFRPDLRVLYTSGYTENAIIHQGRLDPGVQLLSKPYRRRDLALKLHAVLNRGATGQ